MPALFLCCIKTDVFLTGNRESFRTPCGCGPLGIYREIMTFFGFFIKKRLEKISPRVTCIYITKIKEVNNVQE